jgi:hypothetical protein
MNYLKQYKYTAIGINGDCYLSSNYSKLLLIHDILEYQIFKTTECFEYFEDYPSIKYPNHIFAISIIRFHKINDDVVMTNGWRRYKFFINTETKYIKNYHTVVDLFTSFEDFSENLAKTTDIELEPYFINQICERKSIKVIKQIDESYVEFNVKF